VQPVEDVLSEPVDRRARRDAGLPQHLVGEQVAHPGQDGLVLQPRLHGRLAPPEALPELGLRDRQGVRAEAVEIGFEAHPAQPALVEQPQPPTVGEGDREALPLRPDRIGFRPVGLLKISFADSGTKADILANLAATRQWVAEQNVENLATARAYLAGEGAFPQRAALNQLAGRFLTDYYAMVDRWATWATEVIEAWPDDPRQAHPDPAIYEEAIRIAERIPPPGVTRSAG
jgi:hypothetical protein